jgi:hypothetical protein
MLHARNTTGRTSAPIRRPLSLGAPSALPLPPEDGRLASPRCLVASICRCLIPPLRRSAPPSFPSRVAPRKAPQPNEPTASPPQPSRKTSATTPKTRIPRRRPPSRHKRIEPSTRGVQSPSPSAIAVLACPTPARPSRPPEVSSHRSRGAWVDRAAELGRGAPLPAPTPAGPYLLLSDALAEVVCIPGCPSCCSGCSCSSDPCCGSTDPCCGGDPIGNPNCCPEGSTAQEAGCAPALAVATTVTPAQSTTSVLRCSLGARASRSSARTTATPARTTIARAVSAFTRRSVPPEPAVLSVGATTAATRTMSAATVCVAGRERAL